MQTQRVCYPSLINTDTPRSANTPPPTHSLLTHTRTDTQAHTHTYTHTQTSNRDHRIRARDFVIPSPLKVTLTELTEPVCSYMCVYMIVCVRVHVSVRVCVCVRLCACVREPGRGGMRVFVRELPHTLTCSLTHSLAHSLTRSLTHSLTHSLHSLILRSLTPALHSLTHTHSLTHFPSLNRPLLTHSRTPTFNLRIKETPNSDRTCEVQSSTHFLCECVCVCV